MLDFWGLGFDVAERMRFLPVLRERSFRRCRGCHSLRAAGVRRSPCAGEKRGLVPSNVTLDVKFPVISVGSKPHLGFRPKSGKERSIPIDPVLRPTERCSSRQAWTSTLSLAYLGTRMSASPRKSTPRSAGASWPGRRRSSDGTSDGLSCASFRPFRASENWPEAWISRNHANATPTRPVHKNALEQISEILSNGTRFRVELTGIEPVTS